MNDAKQPLKPAAQEPGVGCSRCQCVQLPHMRRVQQPLHTVCWLAACAHAIRYWHILAAHACYQGAVQRMYPTGC